VPLENHDSETKFKVNKLWKDAYLGEGKSNPPMTTRMALVEETLDRVTRNLNKATWLAVAALVGLTADIIKSIFFK